MSYDLIRVDGTYFGVNNHGWYAILELATKHGFQPSDLGNFYGNDEQLVSAADAKALAEALTRAVSQLPADYSREGRGRLIKCIEFCRQGEFQIY